MARIGRTPDGCELYKYLQRELLEVPSVAERDTFGALRQIHGRRLFAEELRKYLAPGVKQFETRIDERAIIAYSRPEPVRLDTQQRGAARRGLNFTFAGPGPDDVAE